MNGTNEDNTPAYTARDYFAQIDASEYITKFRDVKKFIECCKRCPNYNNSWMCPTFNRNIDCELEKFNKVFLIATKISLITRGLPLSMSKKLIRPEHIRLGTRLLEMEKQYGGQAFAYVGTCLYCPEGTCARKKGLPCRHPDKARPSLESYGFDIGKTSTELFGIPLIWGKNGEMPEYLTMVCGLFHNFTGEIKF